MRLHNRFNVQITCFLLLMGFYWNTRYTMGKYLDRKIGGRFIRQVASSTEYANTTTEPSSASASNDTAIATKKPGEKQKKGESCIPQNTTELEKDKRFRALLKEDTSSIEESVRIAWKMAEVLSKYCDPPRCLLNEAEFIARWEDQFVSPSTFFICKGSRISGNFTMQVVMAIVTFVILSILNISNY